MALKLNVATPRNGSNSQDLDNLYVVWGISKRKLKLIVFMVLRLLSRWDVKDCTRNLNYKTCEN